MKYLLMLCTVVLVSCSKKNDEFVELFDGKTTTGWHNYNKDSVSGWHVMHGELMTHGKSGDLVSDNIYSDFDLRFDFKVAPKGNSGLLYKVTEHDSLPAPYHSGPEFQIIDDKNYPDRLENNQKTGANYGLNAPLDSTATKPAGEWNNGRLLIDNNRIEHWLNGVKVASYTYGDESWKKAVAATKFGPWYYANPRASGKICLQDHGDAISFKNIRIKEIKN
jgi:hypothetical protein